MFFFSQTDRNCELTLIDAGSLTSEQNYLYLVDFPCTACTQQVIPKSLPRRHYAAILCFDLGLLIITECTFPTFSLAFDSYLLLTSYDNTNKGIALPP